MAADFNKIQGDNRHRERRDRLQGIRNDLTTILNSYYEDFPESESEERNLEYKIERELVGIQRKIDGFISDFRRYPNK